LLPDQSPVAVHDVGAFVVVHVSVGFTTFTVPVVGDAVRVTIGIEATGV
jgi:hypothetical protein